MLTCVCRPVSGNLPKMPPSVRPITKQRTLQNNINNNNNNIINNNNNIYNNNHMVVVTAEPKLNVSPFLKIYQKYLQHHFNFVFVSLIQNYLEHPFGNLRNI